MKKQTIAGCGFVALGVLFFLLWILALKHDIQQLKREEVRLSDIPAVLMCNKGAGWDRCNEATMYSNTIMGSNVWTDDVKEKP